MQNSKVIPLDERIYLIDGFDMGIPNRTGTYLITEEELTIIETGPSPSVQYIKNGIEQLGYSLQQVKYIIVTHVHLDHAGGAGVLLQQCPNAKVVIHPRGARHLINPKKLAGAARAIYGESFSDFFDPIKPVPEDRLISKGEGDTLEIGDDCTLRFLDTPGHARHHFSIFDPVSNGIFTGDTVGIRYQQLADEGVDFYLPTTSPNHFDPKAMKQSIERIRKLNVDRIYFGHFGVTSKPLKALNEVERWINIFIEEAEQAYFMEKLGYDAVAQRLLKRIKEDLKDKGIGEEHDVFIIINLDLQISSLGIIDYFQKLTH